MLDPVGRFTWNLVARSIALTESWATQSPVVVRAKAETQHSTPSDASRWKAPGPLAWRWRAALWTPCAWLRACGVRRPGEPHVLRADGPRSRKASRPPSWATSRAGACGLPSSQLWTRHPCRTSRCMAALALVEQLVRDGDVVAAKVELSRAEALAGR